MHEDGAAIRVEGLVKRFGDLTAVDNISFHVNRGEIFGILGPNGAGKTTTLEIIEGLQKPDQGRISVLDQDLRLDLSEIKSRIGVQLQSSAYFDYLNLKEILSLLGSFYPQRVEPDILLEYVGLQDRASDRLNRLSGGQKQRFTVAASLVNDPDLVILDEPSTGMDPQARRNLWALIQNINSREITVVLTTHYMEEAAILCHRLAIMDRGRLVAIDTPSNLLGLLDATYTVKLVSSTPLPDTQLASFNRDIAPVQALGDNTYLLRLNKSTNTLEQALHEIVGSNVTLDHLEITPVSLEDVFLSITGREL